MKVNKDVNPVISVLKPISSRRAFAKDPVFTHWGQRLDRVIVLFKKSDWRKPEDVKRFNHSVALLGNLLRLQNSIGDWELELRVRKMVNRRLIAMNAFRSGSCIYAAEINDLAIQYDEQLVKKWEDRSHLLNKIDERLKDLGKGEDEELLLSALPYAMKDLYDLARLDGLVFNINDLFFRDVDLKIDQLVPYIDARIEDIQGYLREATPKQQREYDDYFYRIEKLLKGLRKKSVSAELARSDFKQALKQVDLHYSDKSIGEVKELFGYFLDAAYAIKDANRGHCKEPYLRRHFSRFSDGFGLSESVFRQNVANAKTFSALRWEIHTVINTLDDAFRGNQPNGKSLRYAGFDGTGLRYEVFRMLKVVEELQRQRVAKPIVRKSHDWEPTKEYTEAVQQVKCLQNQKLFRRLGFFICFEPRFDTVFKKYKDSQKDLSSSVVYALHEKGAKKPIKFVINDDGTITSFDASSFDDGQEYAGVKHLLDELGLMSAVEKLFPPKKKVKVDPLVVKNKS